MRCLQTRALRTGYVHYIGSRRPMAWGRRERWAVCASTSFRQLGSPCARPRAPSSTPSRQHRSKSHTLGSATTERCTVVSGRDSQKRCWHDSAGGAGCKLGRSRSLLGEELEQRNERDARGRDFKLTRQGALVQPWSGNDVVSRRRVAGPRRGRRPALVTGPATLRSFGVAWRVIPGPTKHRIGALGPVWHAPMVVVNGLGVQ